ncbi:MAG: hypothetical protein SFU84_05295 [Gemmatimonadales bacterium]|nr:hypothetical protein [Gemmatimonadales bacterium]
MRMKMIPHILAFVSLVGCGPEAATNAEVLSVTVTAGPEPLLVPFIPQVVLRKGGGFYATGVTVGEHAQDRVLELDEALRVVGVVGGAGPGPGEYKRPQVLLTRGDSLLVGTERGTTLVFDSERRHIGDLALPTRVSGTLRPMRGDTLLLVGPIQTTERFGYPLHVISPTGDTVRSFGTEDRTFSPEDVMQLYRHTATVGDSVVWTSRVSDYKLELWRLDGERHKSFAPETPWFRPWNGQQTAVDSVLPQTRVQGIGVINHDELIVLLDRPRPDWRALGDQNQPHQPRAYSIGQTRLYVEQVLQRVDTATGAVTAESVLTPQDVYWLRFLHDGRLVGLRITENGDELVVGSVSVVRQ